MRRVSPNENTVGVTYFYSTTKQFQLKREYIVQIMQIVQCDLRIDL